MPRVNPSRATQLYLWAESGGYCQNPTCTHDLNNLKDAPVAEMAHIIAASADGPRGTDDGGQLGDPERADASNLLLLCPTCHTKIDKSPQLYDVEILRGWKARSQAARETAFGSPIFERRELALGYVRPLFASNKSAFDLYGPDGDVRDVDRADQWLDLMRTMIIPNSATLLKVFNANTHLMTESELAVRAEFEIHVKQLHDRHVLGDWTAQTIRFPHAIQNVFGEETP